MHTRLLAGGNLGFHQITGLEAVNAFLAHQVTTREAKAIQAGALVAAPAGGFDR